MKVDPLEIIINSEKRLDKKFYYITGNEVTLMQKIKDILISYYTNSMSVGIEKIKDVGLCNNEIGLFENQKIYIVSGIKDIDNEFLELASTRNDIFLFIIENSPKSKLIKNFFIKRKDSYLIECYDLSREEKIKLLNHRLTKENFKINEDVIRFLTTKTSKVPTEPTPIMKAKIDKENSDRAIPEVDLKEKDTN